jgi:hypothetical protein
VRIEGVLVESSAELEASACLATVCADERVIILAPSDLTYVALVGRSAELWEAVVNRCVSVKLTDDDAVIVRDLIRRRLLRLRGGGAANHPVQRGPKAKAQSVRMPSRTACWIIVVCAAAALRWRLGRKSIENLLLREGGELASERDAQLARAIATRIDLVCRAIPSRAVCLEKSLALMWFLRRRCVGVLRVGIIAAPFSAHAWVECRDRPVNDRADRVSQFQVLRPVGRQGRG